jgi:hypothetical protein
MRGFAVVRQGNHIAMLREDADGREFSRAYEQA